MNEKNHNNNELEAWKKDKPMHRVADNPPFNTQEDTMYSVVTKDKKTIELKAGLEDDKGRLVRNVPTVGTQIARIEKSGVTVESVRKTLSIDGELADESELKFRERSTKDVKPGASRHIQDPAKLSGVYKDNIRTLAGVDQNANVTTARETGSYRGPIMHANKDILVQVLGNEKKSVIVHDAKLVEMMGSKMQKAAGQQRLVGESVQIHYKEGSGKAYPLPLKDRSKSAEKTPEPDRGR